MQANVTTPSKNIYNPMLISPAIFSYYLTYPWKNDKTNDYANQLLNKQEVNMFMY